MREETQSPEYYLNQSGVECIEVAERMDFCLGNVWKYLYRSGRKHVGWEDLEKALQYITRAQKNGYRVNAEAPFGLAKLGSIIESYTANQALAMFYVDRLAFHQNATEEDVNDWFTQVVDAIEREIESIRRKYVKNGN
jgi:hypothetical protein